MIGLSPGSDISQSSKSSSSIPDSGEYLGRSSGENTSRVTRPNTTKKFVSFSNHIVTRFDSKIINANIESNSNSIISHLGKGADDSVPVGREYFESSNQ